MWIIKDWAGNIPTFNTADKLEFDSFDDAEEFLTTWFYDEDLEYENERSEYVITEVE